MQWLVMSTPSQETKIYLNQKVGSKGTPIFGPYWKLQRVAYKVNKELRSELSLNEDNSHSLVRISHVVNKLVTYLNDELETLEVQIEE